MDLNRGQAAAAHDVGRHVLVAAGAGTGKTRCVIGRLLYLLGEEVAGRRLPPDRWLALRDVVALTFTNAAAADLQGRLRDALRDAGRGADAARVDTALIGTIHGFCGRLLWEFALQVPWAPGLVALDEATSVSLAAECAREALLLALERRDVGGLDALLADLTVDKLLLYVSRLMADADRLAGIAEDALLDARERALVELARRGLAQMAVRQGERSAVDFDALLVRARDLLRDQPGVRRVLQRRIRALIVDEFQDVDPVQREIAWLLADPASGRVDTPRLMLVGDPKQSIFRFRRSDVSLWTRAEREFIGGAGAVHVLSENYRSRRPILAFVDAVVGAELDAPLDPAGRADYEVSAQPLEAARAAPDGAPCVELLVVPPGKDGRARFGREGRQLEACAVAQRVRELIAAGTAAGDIAILLGAWAPAADMARALAAAGVRSWTLRSEGYYERREVVDCLVALRAVLDPWDDLALFGFLRGPMVGVKDETLLAVAAQTRTPYWRRLSDVRTAESGLLALGADVLRRYAALRDRVPHDELLAGLLSETGYLAHLALLGDDGLQPVANVRKLVRKLRDWRAFTLAGVLRMVAEIREREEGAREGDAPLTAQRDAVTITSIHSAKGLEWPVVIWADVSRGAVHPDGVFLMGRDTLRLRSTVAATPDEDPRFAPLRRREAMEAQAERKRLWYVAATRARERLIVSGVPAGALTGRHAGTAAAAVRRLGSLEPGTVAYQDYRGASFTAAVRWMDEAAAALPADRDTLMPVLGPDALQVAPQRVVGPTGRGRHSASELLTFSRCRRKRWFAYVAGLREPEVERTSPRFLDAVTRGQIVHDVLEHYREADELDALLEDAIGRWDPEAPPPEGQAGRRYRGALRGEVERVAGHPRWRALAEADGARRELAFVHLAGEGRVVQGRLDLIAPVGDGLAVLDVKTGAAATEAQAREYAAAYGPQRDVYVGAVEGISGLQLAQFGFLFSRAGLYVGGPVTPAERRAAAQRVEAAFVAIEAGDRSLTNHPEECRFCGYRKAGWCEGARVPKGEEAA